MIQDNIAKLYLLWSEMFIHCSYDPTGVYKIIFGLNISGFLLNLYKFILIIYKFTSENPKKPMQIRHELIEIIISSIFVWVKDINVTFAS